MLVLVVSSSCVSFARAINDNTPGFGGRSSTSRTSQQRSRKTRNRSLDKASYYGDGWLRVGKAAVDSIAASRRASNIGCIDLAAADEERSEPSKLLKLGACMLLRWPF